MTQTQAVRPVAPGERILGLDVFRGFAMFGVLIAYCLWSLGTVPDDQWSPLNKTLGEIAGFVIDGKFYTILAFLFGLGFSLQLERASDSAAAVRTYCRRLAVLAGIGLLHALLLRNGDILFPYAMTGFLLIPFRRASDRLLVWLRRLCLLPRSGCGRPPACPSRTGRNWRTRPISSRMRCGSAIGMKPRSSPGRPT